MLRHVPDDASRLHLLVMASYGIALARATAGPSRDLTRDPDFLRSMYDRFDRTADDLGEDVHYRTDVMPLDEVAGRVVDHVTAEPPGATAPGNPEQVPDSAACR